MAVVYDLEGNETATLQAMVDFRGLSVLEEGCGDGRLTWRYADQAAHVTGIDPDRETLESARAHLPRRLKGRVRFLESTIEDFAKTLSDRRFDIAIFSWSL